VTRRVVVRPSAERDVAEAAAYYLEQAGGREAGLALASRFLAAVRAALTAIAERPLAWPLVTLTKRRYLVSLHDRFPFVVYYAVMDEEIAIVAILRGSRDPARWKHRR
jgi:plasmid stabilization system protein ParE